jgi:hypothetical protein
MTLIKPVDPKTVDLCPKVDEDVVETPPQGIVSKTYQAGHVVSFRSCIHRHGSGGTIFAA